jgi:hypothetical protein
VGQRAGHAPPRRPPRSAPAPGRRTGSRAIRPQEPPPDVDLSSSLNQRRAVSNHKVGDGRGRARSTAKAARGMGG